MAGPLQPVPGYNPGAGGGDPFLHAIGKSLLNVMTLGESQHPGSLRQYGSGIAQSLDPRHPSNWLNIAGILVPGGARRGGATYEQAKFLQAIHESSHEQPHAGGSQMFSRDDPGVQTLMEHLGAPKMSYVAGNQSVARPPWLGLDPRTFGHLRGGTGGRAMTNAFAGDLPIGDLAFHNALVKMLVQKNAIQRRN